MHTTQTAGLGARAFAFTVDWHIRAFIAFAVLQLLLYIEGLSLFALLQTHSALNTSTVVIPLLIYLFYHPLLEGYSGGFTPGKRIAGIRVVTLNNTPASTWQHFIRNVFRLVDSLPILYSCALYTGFMSKSNRRLGDMLSGTQLIYQQFPP